MRIVDPWATQIENRGSSNVQEDERGVQCSRFRRQEKEISESSVMDRKANTRSGWVWAALVLQGAIFLIAAWSSFSPLLSWSRYAQQAAVVLPVIVQSIAETAALGIAFVGLWRSKSWGWILAVLADGAMCLLTLSYLIQYSTLILRHPGWLAFSVWDFVALVVLLHRPVRTYFFDVHHKEIHWAERCVRVLCYFMAAVAVTCVITSFTITLLLAEKAGGGRGFLFLTSIGFAIGAGPSFLFTLLLTLAARMRGPGRLGAWLLPGALLAPGLTLGMGAFGNKIAVSLPGTGWILAAFFTGPSWLFQVWWLTIPTGLIVAFLCFQMFPWGFGEPREIPKASYPG